MSYTFTWASVPADETGSAFKGVIPSSVDGGVAKATTADLNIAGNYVIDLTVSDGCSSVTVRKCFEVVCNCRPTANAGATATVWSNNDGGNFRNLVGATDNTGVSGGQFLLDGRLTNDFDLFHSPATEILTYQWNFVSWEPSNPLAFATHFQPSCQSRDIPYSKVFPVASGKNYYNDNPQAAQNTWTATTNISSTTTSVGFQTQTSGTALSTTIQFVRTPIVRNDLWTNTTTSSRAVLSTPVVQVNDFPMWYPSYHNNGPKAGGEENFMDWSWNAGSKPTNPTTTGCLAWVVKQQTQQTESVGVTTVSVLNKALIETPLVFCKIQITSAGANSPTAFLNILHPGDSMKKLVPDAVPTASFEYCAGLWKFSLTVMDRCGPSRASTDEVLVTVRCNRPPVAVAKCDTTVIFKSDLPNSVNGGFEQVTVDGRSSADADSDQSGGYLTYYWSFLQYPPAYDATCNVYAPCQQQYCQLVVQGTYATAPYVGAGTGTPGKGFGNATRYSGAGGVGGLVGVTGYDSQKCAPTVYPVIYDLSKPVPPGCTPPGGNRPQGSDWCYYEAVPTTTEHKGNSAYFTPSVAGIYKIQLAVFDGCSTAIDSVMIEAQCPPITATAATVTGGPITFAGSATASVKVAGSVTYGDNVAGLKYKFLATPATGSFSAVAQVADRNTVAVSSSFTCSAKGSYTFVLQVDDGCQVFTSAASTPFECRCNGAPTSPTVASLVDGTAVNLGTPLRLKDTTYTYPRVTLTASSVDPEGDVLRYSWSIEQSNSGTFTSLSTSTATVIYNANNNEVQFEPSSTEPARQYRFTVSVTDGCSTVPTSLIVTYDCNPALNILLTPASVAKQAYSFAAPQGFSTIGFDASTSVIPYAQRKSYSWCVYGAGSSCAANDPAATQASAGKGTSSLSWTPSPNVLTTYTVQLNITDGCGFASTQVLVETICTLRPDANLAIVGPSTVVWNSFDSATTGAFPTITLDATASTQVPGATGLTYDVQVQGGGSKVSQGNTPSQFTFRAGSPGSLTFQLTVANGPCTSTNTAVQTVTYVCLALQASLKSPSTGQSVSAPASLALPASVWDGLKFPKVCLDGTGLTYSAAASRGGDATPGNLNSLRITWTFTDSPASSSYLVNRADNTVSSPPAGTPGVVTNLNQVLDPASNATIQRYTTTFTQVRTITSTTQTTTLFNHHYNLPYTCFQPDVTGAYAIELRVDDGCQSVKMAASVSAGCPAVTVGSIKLLSPATDTMEMTGIKFQRVHFDARDTAPQGSKDTLTYEWTLIRPASSKTTIANSQGNVASIVPDVAGVYNLTLAVSDGCNPTQYTFKILTIYCTAAGITAYPADVTSGVGSAQASAGAKEAEIQWVDSTAADPFNGQRFGLTGKSDTSCTVLQRRWRLIARECTTPYTPSVALPTVQAQSTCAIKYTCTWKLVKYPCQASAATFKKPLSGTRLLGEGDTLDNTAGRADQCNARFQCQSPGTYQLSLTVDDGCSTDTKLTTVTCKCETKPIAVTGGPYTSIYACANGNRVFTDTTLDGSKSSVEDIRGGLDLAPCPAAALPAPLPTANPAAGSCCPAQPACPTCPQCPSCPVCAPYTNPSNTVGGAADFEATLPAKNAFYAVPAMQSAPAKKDAGKFAFTDVMGVTVSLLAIMVMTLGGNLLLHMKVRASEKELALL